MILSNVIVDVRISRRSFVLGQSRAKVSAGFLKKIITIYGLRKKQRPKDEMQKSQRPHMKADRLRY